MSNKVEIRLPKAAADITPFFLTAPTTRCGTTLLQRAFCGSSNAICFGELLGKQLEQATTQLDNHILELGGRRDYFNDRLAATLAGKTDQWMPDLIPEVDSYLQTQIQCYFMTPLYYQRFAQSARRPIWGMKTPTWSENFIRQLHKYFAGAKFIFIYRHLSDCLRSAKARKFVTDMAETRSFCETWAKNMSCVSSFEQDAWFLAIRYEDISPNVDATIGLLEAHTGAQAIDKSVFGKKINTWQQQSTSQYVDPLPLSPAEEALIVDSAGEILEKYYPCSPAELSKSA